MNVNFLRKFFMLVLLVVGCARGAWADDVVVELLNADGSKMYDWYPDLDMAISDACFRSADEKAIKIVRCLSDLDCGKKGLQCGYDLTSGSASVILDLNGHTITASEYEGLDVYRGVKLKIIDGATGGKLTLGTQYIVASEGGEIEIASGTYDTGGFYVGGTLTISGGKINFNKEKIMLNIPPKEVNITGGSFKEYNNQKELVQYLNDSYMVSENSGSDGYYDVIPTIAMVLDADGNVKEKYADLLSAVNAATDDNMTVKLMADIDKPSVYMDFNNGKTVTFDLNGHAITSSTQSLGVTNKTKLTLADGANNGSMTFQNPAVIGVEKDSEINIVGGSYYTTSFIVDGILNISGGIIRTSNKNKAVCPYNETSPQRVNVTGGYIKESTDYNTLRNYINDYYVAVDDCGMENYYAVVPLGANLTYGDGTTAKAPVYNGLTLDLKDDESDHNAWVSKIDVPNDTETTDVTVKKNFANTNWHAFYVPFDINVSENLLQNFEIAKIWDTELKLDDNSTTIEFIKLKDGQKISAFTPCLIKATATGKQDITFPNVTVYKNQTKSIDCSNVDETFTFTGVMENTSINGCYALDSETGALVQAGENAKVTPLKFYMTVESKTPATSIKSKKFAVRVIGDETTGISDINAGGTDAKAANATVYNVQGAAVGTSLNGLPAGLYIQNGRKVVVK